MLDLAGRAVALPVAVQLRASRTQDFWQQRVDNAAAGRSPARCACVCCRWEALGSCLPTMWPARYGAIDPALLLNEAGKELHVRAVGSFFRVD